MDNTGYIIHRKFPFAPVYCLAWICLDVLFCTASIMHLCTISVDRYLSLRYPMKFGRNKTRRRVILKIVFVWLLSIAMSLPLSLMYSKDFNSVLVNGSCQIPDPLYKLIGSIVSFYIPLGVMILTYWLTVRHLAAKRQNLQTGISHNSNRNNTKRSWRRMLCRNYRRSRLDETDVRSATGEELTGAMTLSTQSRYKVAGAVSGTSGKRGGCGDGAAGNGALAAGEARCIATTAASANAEDSVDDSPPTDRRHHHRHNHHHRPVTPSESCRNTPFRHNPSVGSTDTEMTSLDARELWLPDTEPTPSTMSALHQFGAEMLRLSRGLEKVASPESNPTSPDRSKLSDNVVIEYDDSDSDSGSGDDDSDGDGGDEGFGGSPSPYEGDVCDSMCSEDMTGTPRCRRAKRQRRRRRRRSGTLHESMRRRFDGHNHNHHPHPNYGNRHGHVSHHHQYHHRHHHPAGRVPRVRSFHEDELRRNRIEPVTAEAKDTGPRIVGTLLKPEYRRNPGLDEEICLLPPPPRRRRRRRRSASPSGGEDTSAAPTPSPLSTPGHPSPQTTPGRTPPMTKTQPPPTTKTQQPPTAARAETVAEWSATSNASKTTLLSVSCGGLPLRRAMTQKLIRKRTPVAGSPSGDRRSPLTRYGSTLGLPTQQRQPVQPQRSNNNNNANRSSVMIRNSYRHGRIIRLEQKATKVLGVVFFTFVFLWTPFFALNMLPSVCPDCEANISKGLIDLVTWLGYASSMVNPVFYTIFNKVFRQAFKRVLMCKYRSRSKRHSWPPQPPARKI